MSIHLSFTFPILIDVTYKDDSTLNFVKKLSEVNEKTWLYSFIFFIFSFFFL